MSSGVKDSEVRRLVLEHKLDMIGLTETKLRSTDTIKVKALWGSDECAYIISHAINSNSEGLLLIWNKNSFNLPSYEHNDGWILINGTITSS